MKSLTFGLSPPLLLFAVFLFLSLSLFLKIPNFSKCLLRHYAIRTTKLVHNICYLPPPFHLSEIITLNFGISGFRLEAESLVHKLHYAIYFNFFPPDCILVFLKKLQRWNTWYSFWLIFLWWMFAGASVTWRTGGIASIKKDGHYVTQLWNTWQEWNAIQIEGTTIKYIYWKKLNVARHLRPIKRASQLV